MHFYPLPKAGDKKTIEVVMNVVNSSRWVLASIIWDIVARMMTTTMRRWLRLAGVLLLLSGDQPASRLGLWRN